MLPNKIDVDSLKVSSLMTNQVFCVSLDNSVFSAQEIMEWNHVRHVPVVDSGYHLKGLITHRDLLKLMCSKFSYISNKTQNELLKRIPIKEVMKMEILTVRPDEPIVSTASLMYDKKIGCLPVVNEDNVLVGIITEADFVKIFSKLSKHQ